MQVQLVVASKASSHLPALHGEIPSLHASSTSQCPTILMLTRMSMSRDGFPDNVPLFGALAGCLALSHSQWDTCHSPPEQEVTPHLLVLTPAKSSHKLCCVNLSSFSKHGHWTQCLHFLHRYQCCNWPYQSWERSWISSFKLALQMSHVWNQPRLYKCNWHAAASCCWFQVTSMCSIRLDRTHRSTLMQHAVLSIRYSVHSASAVLNH